MVTILAVSGLVALFWVAFTLTRIQLGVAELRRSAGEPSRPDMEYPAFSRDLIRHAYDRLDKALDCCLAVDRRLRCLRVQRSITAGKGVPSPEEASLMHESALNGLTWEFMLGRCQFLIEANLRVQRGDWTIAQARFYYRDFETLPLDIEHQAKEQERRWKEISQESPEEVLQDYEKRMRPYEAARQKFLDVWRRRFKAMREPRPFPA